jgi:molybdate transport system regulatory protein
VIRGPQTFGLEGVAALQHAAAMAPNPVQAAMRLRIALGSEIAIGPGKADLLEGIGETGSIASAARRMGMSYKRAWMLVETMNRCFRKPLVQTARGGQAGGGAVLTDEGTRVLRCYRRMEELAGKAVEGEMRSLRRRLVDTSRGK